MTPFFFMQTIQSNNQTHAHKTYACTHAHTKSMSWHLIYRMCHLHINSLLHSSSYNTRICDTDFENTVIPYMIGISLSVTWQMSGFVLSVISSGLATVGINPVVNTFRYFETLNTHWALMTDQRMSVIYLWNLRTAIRSDANCKS